MAQQNTMVTLYGSVIAYSGTMMVKKGQREDTRRYSDDSTEQWNDTVGQTNGPIG